MSRLPLVEGLLKYVEENNVPFSMPGHKGGRGLSYTKEGMKFLNNIVSCDITEVDGLDNLHNPNGIIKESLELLSNFYGSEKSYFLINGSTSGNLAMIFSNFNEGDKIIVERNCHRSIYNGIIMRKLKPVYIKNRMNYKFDAPFSIDKEHFSRIIQENSDAKGIIITYPNYYGICCDLSYIVNEAKKYNMKVLVDSAHGAHFKANKKLPKDALELGCDMVVESSHKTIPSFTQTAFLHVNHGIDTEKVDFYISSFLSTSPSYMLMASMDYGRFFLETYGEESYDKLLELCDEYRTKINELENFHVISKEDLYSDIDLDKTRYIINIKSGYSGHKLLEYLREKKIQCELSDARNVVAIFSPFNDKNDFEALYKALKECNIDKLREERVEALEVEIPKLKLLPYEVIEKKKVKVDINSSLNKICGVSIVPYPPGIPLVMPGEIINKDVIEYINYYVKNNVTILGAEENKISVLEE
ncbi:aminotransferase class V-fold PLP-dependent enzyme [Clostridium faecium]|uniref:Aminotransferase class I/II-fold pyridoxal phosphate-dependent enzyme n=2 Tax=Clostridium TaxID=1485 RepID=A0ABR8YW09_9CLOT|nr:aminotransferase class I/II-fold pyridoxal phosphate-dependent enzyme [Clostridium faecium]MBD8048449.1 aminotransferase class I/II-fold pyridoxal phosphate-dependent enzyme [Clostridium faecium]